MKKLVLFAVALVAMTASVSFVSCNGAAPAADTTACDSVCCDSVVECDTVAADSVAADTVVAE